MWILQTFHKERFHNFICYSHPLLGYMELLFCGVAGLWGCCFVGLQGYGAVRLPGFGTVGLFYCDPI